MSDTTCFGCCNLGKTLDAKRPFQQQEGAKYALRLLFSINLLNFADRYVPAAVKSQIQDALNLNDFQTALPNTGMIVVFMISAVIFGMLADKQFADRRIILAGAVIFWSIATGIAGFSQNFAQLVAFRSLVGVGEAAYGSIAPPMLFDFFPSADRNVVYGVYYLAIPVGGAIGFGVGSILGGLFGWRWAFVACGIPGIIVATLILGLNNPVSGINDFVIEEESEDAEAPGLSTPKQSEDTVYSEGAADGGGGRIKMAGAANPLLTDANVPRSPPRQHQDKESEKRSTTGSASAVNPRDSGYGGSIMSGGGGAAGDKPPTAWEEVLEILSNKVFILAVLGLAANNFALGGLADWIVVFMQRYDDASMEEAGMVVGAATVVGGILGTYLGSITTEYYDGRVKNAYFLIPALYTIPSAVILFLGLNVSYKPAGYVFVFMCQIFIWTNVAPVCTLSIDCIPVRLRARASGLCIFCQHILGDIISPPLIGYISDRTGSLKIAIQITWVAVLLSGCCWFAGYYFLPTLPVMKHNAQEAAKEGGAGTMAGMEDSEQQESLLSPASRKLPADQWPITYEEALCPCCSCCFAGGTAGGGDEAGTDTEDEAVGDKVGSEDVERRAGAAAGVSSGTSASASASASAVASSPTRVASPPHQHMTRRSSRNSRDSRRSRASEDERRTSFDHIPPVSVFIPPRPASATGTGGPGSDHML